MDENELKDNLEKLATRGTPRGAESVLEAARSRATVRPLPGRRMVPVLSIAAAVSLIAGVSAAVIADGRHTSNPHLAIGAVPTNPGPTSTAVTVPEVSIPAKLIAASRLVPFNTCGTYTSYMRAEALKVVSAYGLPSVGGGNAYAVSAGGAPAAEKSSAGAATSGPAAADSSAAPAPQAAASEPLATTGGDYSGTNVQEKDVDEPDVVKTDGKRIYTISNGRLFVVDAASPKILGSYEAGTASELFLVGKRVVLFSPAGYAVDAVARPASGTAAFAPTPGPGGGQTTRITVLDVSSPDAIKEVSHLDVEGGYVSSRLVGGVARVVIQSYPQRMQFTYPTDGSPAAQQAALDKNRATVRNAKYDDWAPHVTVTDSAGRPGAARPLSTCAEAYRPPQFSGFGQLSVMSLDPQNPAAVTSTSVTADGNTVYSSATRLYVATTQWGEVKPVPAATPGAMPEVMAPASPKTLVHDFDISDAKQAHYRVSGEVRGTVLNQFSFSEQDGNVRVATTDGDQSYVTVLADNGKILDQIGQVGGLGKGERIYAVRFIGSLGYVVTFRQVDPLYVVDLHDPTKPRVVGELQLLGYSAYLHPVSDTLLIGVGQDATPEGRRAGTQVSLFDVSNPAAPKLLQRHSLGTGSSQAEYDHHAFLYWAPKQLAVIPVQNYDPNGGGPGFMGAVGMHVVPSEIREVGRVTNHGDYISRSLVIGSHLFTLSSSGLQQSDIDSFAEQSFVSFGPTPVNSSGGGTSSGGGQSSPGSPGQVEPAPPKPQP